MAQRGTYAKGLAKREEILAAALEIIAANGFSGASLQEIAQAVGLSKAGVLHYFDSKEELFVAVLRRRDALDQAAAGASDLEMIDLEAIDRAGITLHSFVAPIRHNVEVPGLTQLYTRLAAEATDPAHAAHDYFVERYAGSVEGLAHLIALLRDAGRLRADIDPEAVADMLLALADGLQTRWLLDPEVDMPARIEAFISLLETPDRP
ncbi:TetR/AcrR family transcriptional regulator [Demequina rhizosphaerae]|uniref:TetR/AcrR family transcriptional regulator n=1 Tax=Demequina rhizosphaerae TaxID=1638985 RepID=UPI000785A923|nr:TetR family transcriptional regulator [Demequina rhizosphaerae]